MTISNEECNREIGKHINFITINIFMKHQHFKCLTSDTQVKRITY